MLSIGNKTLQDTDIKKDWAPWLVWYEGKLPGVVRKTMFMWKLSELIILPGRAEKKWQMNFCMNQMETQRMYVQLEHKGNPKNKLVYSHSWIWLIIKVQNICIFMTSDWSGWRHEAKQLATFVLIISIFSGKFSL